MQVVEAIEVELDVTPDQAEVISCPAKRIAVFAGRRWGKTIGLIRNRVLMRCLTQPGCRYMCVAPSYSQLLTEFEEMAAHPKLKQFITDTRTTPVPRIRFDNDSFVVYRSLDRPNLLRGWGLELKDILGGMGVNALESLRGNRLHLRGVDLTDTELEILGVRMAGN
jgi:hypothetical protein